MKKYTTAAALLLSSTSALTLPTCQTESQPNPIAAQYPSLTTGTTNGSIAILPIKYELARQIIPAQYGILVNSYRSLLPSFAKGMYPAMLQTELDHDVQSSGLSIPDFSRASISFPFVDRLNDGYTAMTYGSQILISATNPVAVAGAGTYGDIVTPATFEPPCDAYEYTAAPDAVAKKETFFAAYAALKVPGISHTFRAVDAANNPYSIDFWKNVTNQPQFSDNPLVCDNYIRLFNSSVTTGQFTPTPVKGSVTAVKPYFAKSTVFKDVWGLQLDNAFIENNFMTCESLKGYSGTGSGD